MPDSPVAWPQDRTRGTTYSNYVLSILLPCKPLPGARRVSSSQPTYIERILDTDKIQLLKAPSVKSDVMWKHECFQSVYSRLRGKLSTSCTADMIISVFSEHFSFVYDDSRTRSQESA